MTTTISQQVLTDTWAEFCDGINQFLQDLGLSNLGLECDHVALRVNSHNSADLLRFHFEQHASIISNNIINGRPILIFELEKALILGELTIDCVELPYPSNKCYPVEGWEHIELVFPCDATSCEELQTQLLKQAPQLERVFNGETEIKVKLSSPKGEHERLANPTIAFKRDNICIKIHPHGIKAVISSEQAD
ncbi:VOC family protein [Shewanella sp. UCD-KL12]|uniref:VOC family protein n=1 Tax=Shewanella sp. UCD-KL12 TaxID=1917163 RepID=UPI00097124D6|nr:VOC family protein [Shewanella sp. UCD-KL12]